MIFFLKDQRGLSAEVLAGSGLEGRYLSVPGLVEQLGVEHLMSTGIKWRKEQPSAGQEQAGNSKTHFIPPLILPSWMPRCEDVRLGALSAIFWP